MGQTSRSHHHPSVEPARHADSSRRNSRREPDNGAIMNDRFRDMNIDAPVKATRKENDGRRGTSHHADGMSSGRHSARIGERGPNVAGNHRSGRDSEARPAKGERPKIILREVDITVIEAGPIMTTATVVREIILQEADITVDDLHTGTLVGSIPQVEIRSHKADIRADEVYTGTLMDPVRIIETSPRKIDIMVNEALVSAVVRFLHKVIPKEAEMTLEEVRTARKTALVQRVLRIKAKVMGKPPNNADEIREQLFQEAFEPISVDTGTPYPCNQADIDFHQRGVFKKDPDAYAFVSCRMATKEVLWQNDERRPTTPDEEAALDRLWSEFQSVEDELSIAPDLVIKAFSDLDLVFFGGRLRGNVAVQWKEDEFFCDYEKPLTVRGHTSVHHSDGSRISVEGRCHIRLNATIIFRRGWKNPGDPEPWQQMIGSLLHEMCHAYEFVRSPREREPDGHGPLFNTRISVVHKRALRMLGMFAISRHKHFKQFHAFVPYPDEGQQDERGGAERDVSRGKPNSQSQRGGAERDVSRSKPNSQSQRGGAERDVSRRQPNSQSQRGGPERDISRSKANSKSERGGAVKDSSRSKPHDGVRIYEYR